MTTFGGSVVHLFFSLTNMYFASHRVFLDTICIVKGMYIYIPDDHVGNFKFCFDAMSTCMDMFHRSCLMSFVALKQQLYQQKSYFSGKV